MKSEHRHELAENDLSKLLGRWAEKFDEHSNTILSVVIVVAFIAAGVIWWTRTSRYEHANGWTQLAASSSAEDYANVADAFSGTPVADWARLRAANRFLEEGIRLSITDRPASNARLEQAKEAFESLTSNRTPSAVREQALNGLAVTLESLSDGDTEPAIAAYQKLLDEFPETRFKDWANERIDALKIGSVQEFYAWFHEQNPQPADMPLPRDRSGPSDSEYDSTSPFGSIPFEFPKDSSDASKTTDDDLNPFEDDGEADESVEEPESENEPSPENSPE